MQIHIEDRRLLPIREKVEAGERLSYDDGVDAVPHRTICWRSAIWRTSCASACTAT